MATSLTPMLQKPSCPVDNEIFRKCARIQIVFSLRFILQADRLKTVIDKNFLVDIDSCGMCSKSFHGKPPG